jgi:hypothetical protein
VHRKREVNARGLKTEQVKRSLRLILSLIRSSGKAANVPKPTSVGITSSQIRIDFGVAWSMP